MSRRRRGGRPGHGHGTGRSGEPKQPGRMQAGRNGRGWQQEVTRWSNV
jgi:hypothetical protein